MNTPGDRAFNSEDNETSTHDFMKSVWPLLEPVLGGQVIRIEGAARELQEQFENLDAKTRKLAVKLEGPLALLMEILPRFDYAGWDYVHVDEKKGGLMRGLAVRMQRPTLGTDRVFRTTTLRFARWNKRTGKITDPQKLEYHKRLRAYSERSEGWINPGLTIHGYVDHNGVLLRVAVMKTLDLCAFIDNCPATDGSADAVSLLKTHSDGSPIKYRRGQQPTRMHKLVKMSNVLFDPVDWAEVTPIIVIDPFGDAVKKTRALMARIGLRRAAERVTTKYGWDPRIIYQIEAHIRCNWP